MSTDTSQLLPNSVAVSSDCLYNLKPSSVRAKAYRASIPTSNKSLFNPGDLAIFYIPGGRRNTYLDPTNTYLRYTVRNNDTTVSANNFIQFDGCGASVINRIDVYHGSNLLETVQQYNVLYNYFLDFQYNLAEKAGLANCYATVNSNTLGYGRNGVQMLSQAGGNVNYTVCMPILSSVFGLTADKNLPIGLFSDDIRIELSWEQATQGMVFGSATSTNWTIIQAELVTTIIELSDEGENMVRSTTPPENPIYLHGVSFRHFTSNIASGTSGVYSTLVPSRFASLKTLILCPRRANEINGASSYSISSRINPNISWYWWRIGGSIVPQKYVVLENANTTGGYGEAFIEIMRSFHSLDSSVNASSLPQTYFNVTDKASDLTQLTSTINTGLNSYQNGFSIAQELESFSQRSDLLISGMNTLSSQCFFECQINTAPTGNYTLDFYAQYDVIYVLENGLLSARF
jgi:hypothetical protein